MANLRDDTFYERADAHIFLANDQTKTAPHGMVTASLMFATARFAAFLAARGHDSGEAMQASRQQTIDYFMDGFRQMLEDNIDAHVRNFDAYMKPGNQ